MLLKDFEPSPAVRGLVQCYRIADLDFTGIDTVPVKVYPPKPENCLHFILEGHYQIAYPDSGSATYCKAVFVGQHQRPFYRLTGQRLRSFQIVFEPGGVFQLLRIPAQELCEQHIDADLIFSGTVHHVTEQLQASQTPDELIAIAEEYVASLLRKARQNDLIYNTLISLIRKQPAQKVDALANQTSLSIRQFERVFLHRTGMNPKTYLRLVRFHQAYNTRNRFPQLDWLSIALTCNYHDYQHLVRDYKAFTGMGPNDFHSLEKHSPECLLGLANDLYKSRDPQLFSGNKQGYAY
ncbi:helix-turn-helix domain-containing protein [Spirosoma arcticum]